MAYEIEDGEGSRSKVSIFENRLRTLATECSLMNHISGELNEFPEPSLPSIGVYDTRAVTSVAGSGMSLIYLVNNDTENFINVDRIFTNTVESAIALPDTSTFVQIIMGSVLTAGTGIPIKADNTNNSIINVQPDITLLNGAVTSGGVELQRRYLIIARVYQQEPMPQKSDGILLGKGNSMEIFLSTLASTTVEINMRFAMTDPDDLGIR